MMNIKRFNEQGISQPLPSLEQLEREIKEEEKRIEEFHKNYLAEQTKNGK